MSKSVLHITKFVTLDLHLGDLFTLFKLLILLSFIQKIKSLIRLNFLEMWLILETYTEIKCTDKACEVCSKVGGGLNHK